VPTRPWAATPTADASADPRTAGWRADIDQLIDGLKARHPNIESQVALSDLEQAATSLAERVPTATDDELMVGIMGIVAMVSAKGCDAHTGAYVWGGGSYPITSMPLRLWLFGSEVYIVDALPPYQGLIGQRITSVDGVDIDDLMTLIDPIVPRDNSQTVRLLMPRFLLIPQILRGLGIQGDADLVVRTQEGSNTFTNSITPIPMADYNAWAGGYGLHLPADPDVPYLSRIDELLWSQKLPDGSLYVQYNRVESTSLADLQTALEDPTVDRVVLDLRHNYGGEVSVMETMVSIFRGWADVSQDHRLAIATGRNTFSAGSLMVAKLQDQSDAEIVGEAMGGCPSGWGNNRDFELGYSGIPISVSTTFETGAAADDSRPTIEPDTPLGITFQDWQQKVDPLFEAHTAN
jgi:hypothetical protein